MEYMAFAPRPRMDPPPRSFAPDAHACIMVLISIDQPNTSLRRDIASKASSPRKSSSCPIAETSSRLSSLPPCSRPSRAASLRDGLRPPLTVAPPGGQPSLSRDEEMSVFVEQGDDTMI